MEAVCPFAGLPEGVARAPLTVAGCLAEWSGPGRAHTKTGRCCSCLTGRVARAAGLIHALPLWSALRADGRRPPTEAGAFLRDRLG